MLYINYTPIKIKKKRNRKTEQVGSKNLHGLKHWKILMDSNICLVSTIVQDRL